MAEEIDSAVLFEERIRPLLVSRCYECHHGEEAKGGLRLDHPEGILQGGERGPAVTPGNASASLIIQAVGYETDLQMPPAGKLRNAEIAALSDWINAGAPWPEKGQSSLPLKENPEEHWAFQPLGDPEPPAELTSWSTHPIDRFISRRQFELETSPVSPADARTLLRRVYFDLIGLPPSYDEIQQFQQNHTPEAFAKIVERLLQSPQYGERWGRHWMDVVRYADTAGDNADYPIPEMHLYRNYIIDSFNEDFPFDQFVREQLAGDILAKNKADKRYAEKIVATGFLALSRRYGTTPYELPHLIMEDSIETTGRVFLGLAFRCARCHDHKFDPVTMEDYYSLYGIFASTQYPFAGAEVFASQRTPRKNFIPIVSGPEVEEKVARFRQELNEQTEKIKSVRSGEQGQQLAAVGERINKLNEDITSGVASGPELEELHKKLEEELAQRQKLKKIVEEKEKQLRDALPRSDLPPDLPVAYAVAEGPPTNSAIQKRGQPGELGKEVARGVPKFFLGSDIMEIPSDRSGRLELAEWLTDPNSLAGALFARVAVNRIWHYHFGKGLVRDPSNFGTASQPPSHPELLDYLARKFIESDWSVKEMHRLILSSRTYRLDSVLREDNQEIDPANDTYWRWNRRRLEAESLRDAILLVCGTLNPARPGPHPFPPIETWVYTQHEPFQDIYPSSHRSVYLLTQRFQKHPFLMLFDQPDTNTSTGRRTSATVPLQSLYLMNNPWIDEQARSLATRILEEDNAVQRRIAEVFQIVFGRDATENEIRMCETHLRQAQDDMHSARIAESERELACWSSLTKVLLTSNEFMYID